MVGATWLLRTIALDRHGITTRDDDEEEEDDLGLVTVALRLKLGMNLRIQVVVEVVRLPQIIPTRTLGDLWGCW